MHLLPLEDTITCMTVSKKWFQVTTSCSFLYSRVDISSQQKFGDAMSHFNNNNRHYIAENVNCLSITNVNMDPQLLSSLPTLFPNVKQLVWWKHM